MEIKLKDLEKRFDVPVHTLRNWEKDDGQWRQKLFNHMVTIMIKEEAARRDNGTT